MRGNGAAAAGPAPRRGAPLLRRDAVLRHPVLRYLGGRLLLTTLVLFGATVLLFALTLAIPGNPAQVMLGPRATPEAVAAFTAAMGLDQPVPVRLLRFLGNVVRGDLGRDVVSGRPVLALVLEVFPYTLSLTAAAIAMAIVVGVPLGCLSAVYRNSPLDQVTAVLSVSVIAVPNFVVAVALVLVFSVWLGWLPVLGTGAGAEGGGGALARLVLPALSLGLSWIGYIARLLRASLLEVLGEAHIRTDRAYGMAEGRIVGKYALRLAAIPTLAILGLGVGRLLGGAIFAEIVFSRPGLGTLVYDAINLRNYPVLQASVLVVVFVFTLTNLLVDMLYAWLDPRLRGGAGR